MNTQHDNHDPVDNALDQLSSREFNNTSTLDKLEDTLTDQFTTRRKPLLTGPYRLAFLIICLLLIGGGGIAATTAIIAQFKLYDVEIKVDNDVIDASILVADGEVATMTITDENGDVRSIEIDEAGNVIYTGDGDAEIKIEVHDIEAFDTGMVVLEFTITQNDEVISMPKIFLNVGDTGSIELGSKDSDGNDVIISITTDSKGNFELEGPDGIEATVIVTDIASDDE